MTTRTRWSVPRWLRTLDARTRPVHPETASVMRSRWDELPTSARTAEQTLGRIAVGCEGTHGVFPRCNLTCTPCYHSADANKVRIDGDHTRREVTTQMRLLRRLRGPRAHAQLIGGEVSLLSPDDHAEALLAMRRAGREPMSMTHGDFDPAYLEALVTGADGRLRLPRVSFAAHVDSLMRGRRGAPRPRTEAELDGHRRAFVDMFADLRRRTGLRYFLAHNMTVTQANLAQVAGVVRSVTSMRYSMLSFQPAALVGDERRWNTTETSVGIDDVWDELELGLGQPVAWQALQFGDPRCNRTAFGLMVSGRWVPLLDPASPGDLALRDQVFDRLAGVSLTADGAGWAPAKVARIVLTHPALVPRAIRWSRRLLARAGGIARVARAVARRELRSTTFVVHAFMDAAEVLPAWRDMEAGVTAADPAVRATQERLAACSYAMAHPETGRLVPACVQHSVLDPGENRRLRTMLPMPTVRS